MNQRDFLLDGITYFTAEEVEATGAKLGDVQVGLMIGMNSLRVRMGREIHLIANGITTGEHVSEWHAKGLACDFYFAPAVDSVNFSAVIEQALSCNFRGVGVYWNGNDYSFHVDLRPNYSFWSAMRGKDGKWLYRGLFLDPKIDMKRAAILDHKCDPRKAI